MRHISDVVDAAVAGGLPPGQVLDWAGGLDVEMLKVPRARVRLQQFSRLYGAVAQRLGDESAGLSAYRIPLGAIETMCRAASTASSLGECAELVVKSLNATVVGIHAGCAVNESGIHIVLTESEPTPIRRLATFRLLLLTAYATMGWLFGRRLLLVSVDFPCAAPKHLFELRSLFSGRIRFSQPNAALHFAPSQAELQVVRTPAEMGKFLRRAPGSLIEALITRGQLTVELRRCIHDRLPKVLTLEQAAQHFALSPRSLHRKLEAEGTSFQKIKDELRRDLAIHALTRSRLPLKQIALKLGFFDQVSFQRAFAQWTGRPPGAWRRIAVPS